MAKEEVFKERYDCSDLAMLCAPVHCTLLLLPLTVLHFMQTIPGAASKREEAAVVRCLQSQQGDVSQTCSGVPDRVTR